jgi:hypothetical protein
VKGMARLLGGVCSKQVGVAVAPGRTKLIVG